MVTVNDLRAFGQQLQDDIPGINYNQVILDESQLHENLKEISPSQNHLLYLVVPSTNNEGRDDAIRKNNAMMLLILKKGDESISLNDLLDEIQTTQEIASLVEQKMLIDKDESCGLMKWLDGVSIQGDPYWGIAGCNGWGLKFFLKTNL